MQSLLFILIPFFISNTDIKEIRRLYDEAIFNEEKNSQLILFVESKNEKSALLTGYKGTAIALQAKHSYNP